MLVKSLFVLTVATLAACGDGADPQAARTTVVDGREVFVIEPREGECDDTGVCAATWRIYSSVYTIECSPVAESERAGELLAVGADDDAVPILEARQIPGVDSFERVAARLKQPGLPCPRDRGAWVTLRFVALIAEPLD